MDIGPPNIETMFANRVAMAADYFAGVFAGFSFVDALIFPLSNEAAKRSNPTIRVSIRAKSVLLKRYLADLKSQHCRLGSYEYLKTVVTQAGKSRSGMAPSRLSSKLLTCASSILTKRSDRWRELSTLAT